MTGERKAESPQLLAIRQAERDILEAVDLNPPKAVLLGRGLVQATLDYYVSFAQGHNTPHLHGFIERQTDVLEALDAGDTQKLRVYLEIKADDLFSPEWLMGQSPELLELPDKLRELARAIGN